MKISGYILARYNNMANSYTCYRLVDEAKSLGMDIRLIGVEDSWIEDGILYNSGEALLPRDFLINRYKTGILRHQINLLAKRTYNQSDNYRKYVNKFNQVRDLRSDYFTIPHYILTTSTISYDILRTRIGSPFVAKGLESSMGREIFLINDENELDTLRTQFGSEKEWLFQEFIHTSRGRDLRVFAIRDRAVAAMTRQSQNDFRANVALGASVKAVPITSEINHIVRDIYDQTHLDFVGIDLLFGDNTFYLCEINVMPGLEGIEKSSGINIAKVIMETIISDYNNE